MGEIGPKKKTELKVENWSPFLLKRVYNFFLKSEHCDLSLKFSNDTVVKVHKLVLYACSEYFDMMVKRIDSDEGEVLDMTDDMVPDVLLPIITFMYTGRLEYFCELQDKIYEASKMLRMHILTRLMDSQLGDKKPSINPIRDDESCTPAVQVTQVPSNCVLSTPKMDSPIVSLHSDQSQLRPSYPIKHVALMNPLVSKRTILRKREVLGLNPSSFLNRDDGKARLVLSAPVPTRFEWDSIIDENKTLTPVGDGVRAMSHDCQSSLSHPLVLEGSESTLPDGSLMAAGPPFSRNKSDLSDMKEFGKQHQIRSEIAHAHESEDEDDPGEGPSPEVVTPTSRPKPILKPLVRNDPTDSPKRVRFCVSQSNDSLVESTSSSPLPVADSPAIITPDMAPALPPAIADGHSQIIKLSEEKKSLETSGELIVSEGLGCESRVRYSVLPTDPSVPVDQKTLAASGVGNPAKIVSEVLKKYPNLVTSHRKNIKLKVVTNNSSPAVGQPGDASRHQSQGSNSNVSYIVVKGSDGSSPSIDPSNELNPENMSGPWICTPCGDGKRPIAFSSYQKFRYHLTFVHQIKIDPRICSYCGFRASKRNAMIYHLYTSHGVEPPANFTLLKCCECDFIGFSKPHLIKHMETHATFKSNLTCVTCNATFKSSSQMANHLRSEWHERRSFKELLDYPCPFCDSEFQTADELKNHIEHSHQNKEIGKSDGVNLAPSSEPMQPENSLIPSTDSMESSDSIMVTDEEVEQVEPSSELGALHSVASGISTSLHLSTNEEQYEDDSQVVTEEFVKEEVEEGYLESEEVMEDYEQPGRDEYGNDQEVIAYDNRSEIDYNQMTELREGETFVSVTPEEGQIYVSESSDGTYKSDGDPGHGGVVYEGMEVEQEVAVDSDPVDETEMTANQAAEIQSEESNSGAMEIDVQRGEQGDHDYAPYSSVVMFQPNVVLPQRVILTQGNMLVTHPIQVLPQTRILLSAPNILQDQLVSIPYSQVVESGTTQEVSREKKVETTALVSEWDENSQTEAVVAPTVTTGSGPSRPDFF